mmetsp:Transcript_41602/g.96191  ORF Transcript_41602/g.96191 Transcript_41602/m.96191 type:complete len:232 (+) Transcript_41602:390-1085(+)
MHVVLGVVGHVEIHHHLHVLHIETACRHIRCNQDHDAAVAEVLQRTVALVLGLVPVDCICRVALLPDRPRELVGPALGLDKYDHTLALEVLTHKPNTPAILIVVVDDLDHLGDRLVGRQLKGADCDLVEVGEEVTGHTLDLLRPRRRPHERLPIGPDLAHNLTHLRLETHVKHAVGLVKHEVGHALKVGDAGLEVVDQTTRGGDHDLDAVAEIRNLGALGYATVHAGVLYA